MTRKFITCSNCGKKIYEGEDVVFQDGIIYRCCSSACLANLMLNISCRTLNDEFMTSQEEEWETEEIANVFDASIREYEKIMESDDK